MKRVAILVTGTREESPELWLAIRDALRPFLECHVVLIHGNATGADTIAKHCLERAQQAGKKWDPCQLSYFSDLGRRGGMARNRPMVEFLGVLKRAGFECRAFAFPDDQSVGTRGCMSLLMEAGFTVAVQEMGPRKYPKVGPYTENFPTQDLCPIDTVCVGGTMSHGKEECDDTGAEAGGDGALGAT